MLYKDYLKLQNNKKESSGNSTQTVSYGSQYGYGTTGQNNGSTPQGVYGNYLNNGQVNVGAYGNYSTPVSYSGFLDSYVTPTGGSKITQPSYGGNPVSPNYVGAGYTANGGKSITFTPTSGAVKYADYANGNANVMNTGGNNAAGGNSGVGNTGAVATPTADAPAATESGTTAVRTDGTTRTDGIYGEYIRDRDRAITDAQNSYTAQMGRYGVNAEQLNDSGLAGSGYAAYLESKAYSDMRDEVQTANATYATNVRTADAKINESFANDLISVNNGTYTETDIDALAAKNGYSAEQITELKNAAATYTQNAQQSEFYKLSSSADAGTLTVNEILSGVTAKSISEDHATQLVSRLGSNIFRDGESNLLDYDNAKINYNNIINSPNVPDTVKTELENQFDAVYGFTSLSSAKIRGDGKNIENDLTSTAFGIAYNNNMFVTYNGTEYKIEEGGEVDLGTNEDLANVIKEKGVTKGLFAFGGKIYYKHKFGDGSTKVYVIQNRGNKATGDATKLFEDMFLSKKSSNSNSRK
jgi:hypothetical protein